MNKYTQHIINKAVIGNKKKKKQQASARVEDVVDLLDDVGLNPIKALAELALNQTFLNERESRLHVDILKDLAERQAPKKQVSEQTVDMTNRVISAEPISEQEWAEMYERGEGQQH